MQGAYSKEAVDAVFGWPGLPRDMDTVFFMKIATKFSGYVAQNETYLYRRNSTQLTKEPWYMDLEVSTRKLLDDYMQAVRKK
jgi:hypothetical protein